MNKRLRIGSRGSKLAILQAESIREQIVTRDPEIECEMIEVTTTGDRNTEVSLEQLGGEGVFVKELEEALLHNEIDIAVHSLKDMLTTLPEGLHLAAVPQRVDPRDALVSSHGKLAELPKGAIIGTGSFRRAIQIRSLRPDLGIQDLRGNIDTRIRKAFSEEYDGIIMAAAALIRLSMEEYIGEFLNSEAFVPAVGQGAIGIEIRADNQQIQEILKPLNHESTWQAVTAERSFLKAFGGGCRAPIAALGTVENGVLNLNGIVADSEGSRILRTSVEGSWANAEELGNKLAEKMTGLGAEKLIERNRCE